MTSRVIATLSSSLLLLAAVHAEPPAQRQAWEKQTVRDVRIEVPRDCKTKVQTTPGIGGAVQKMTKYSFRTSVLDLELVFLSFPPGMVGSLDGAAENMSGQIRQISGEGSLTPWKAKNVSGRPARYMATKPDASHEARQVTLIDDTRAKNQLVIVDISYDSTSRSGKADCERITKSVEIR
jgi:hypothetical protein